jgi:homoserine O-acetyltransferase
MPKSKFLPYEWYNTPNIHLFSLNDFISLCKKEGISVKTLKFVNSNIVSKILTRLGFKNLGVEQVVALVSND